jgi:hypothetical protein
MQLNDSSGRNGSGGGAEVDDTLIHNHRER